MAFDRKTVAVLAILVLVCSLIPIAYVTTIVPESISGGGGGGSDTINAQCPANEYMFNITITNSSSFIVCSAVAWGQIVNFPSNCGVGQFVYGVTASNLVCATPTTAGVNWSQIQNFPTGSGGCASGSAFVYKLNSTNYYCSKVSFKNLTDLPANCTAGTYAVGINSTMLQCTTLAWSSLTGFPSGCSSGYFVTAVGSTLTCNQVQWGQLVNFPTSCTSGQFVTGANATKFFCAQVQVSQLGGNSSCPTNPQQYVITVAASVICATPVDSIKINSNATLTGVLQFLNSTTIGIYNGAGNTVFWKILSVQWNTLTGFPSGCSAGMFVTAVGTTLTCATPSGSGAGTGTSQCSSNQYVYNVTDTSSGPVTLCAQVQLSQLGGYHLCSAGQYVYNVSAVPLCAQVQVSELGGNSSCPTGPQQFVITVKAVVVCATPVDSITVNTNATLSGLITLLNTTTVGIYNGQTGGHTIYFKVNQTALTINWSQLTNFPAACSAGQYVYQVGTTLSCAQVQLSQIGGSSSCPVGPQQYVITVAATVTCATPVDSITVNANATLTGLITFMNTTTVGVYNGATGGNTIFFKINSVPWSSITGFPSGCSANQWVTAVGTTLTCSGVSWSQIQNFPTGLGTCQTGYSFVYQINSTNYYCSAVSFAGLTHLPSGCTAGQYATAVNSTSFTCSHVGWTQLTGFPSACSANEWVTAVNTTLTCTNVAWGQITSFPSGEIATFASTCGTANDFVYLINSTNYYCKSVSSGSVAWSAITGIPSGEVHSYSSTCSSSNAYIYFFNATNAYCSAVSFAGLTNLPTGCSANTFATGVNSTAFTCTAVAWAALTAFPSACSAGYFVTGVGSTLTCTQVAWGNIINLPTGINGQVNPLAQTGHCSFASSGSSCTISFTSVKVGDELVVGYGSNGGTYVTPSDGSNTYTSIVESDAAGTMKTQLWSAPVTTGGSLTITCAISAPLSFGVDCTAQEYYGIAGTTWTSSGRSVSSSNQATISPAFSPCGACVLVTEAGSNTHTTITAGTDFTIIAGSGTQYGGGQYNTTWDGVSGSQSTSTPINFGTSVGWSIVSAYATGCGNENAYIYKINTTSFYCSGVPFTSLINFPAGCASGQAVQVIATTLVCVNLSTVAVASSTCAGGSFVTSISTTTFGCSGITQAVASSTCAAGSAVTSISTTAFGCSGFDTFNGATVSCAAGSAVTSIATSTATCSHFETVGATASCAVGSAVTSIATSTGVCQQIHTLATATSQIMSTTTFTTVGSMSVSVSASTVYTIKAVIIYKTAGSSTGIKLGYSAPAGATAEVCFWTPIGLAGGANTGCETATSVSYTSTAAGPGTSDVQVIINGYISVSSTAGTFGFLFASSGATSVTIEAGSWVELNPLTG